MAFTSIRLFPGTGQGTLSPNNNPSGRAILSQLLKGTFDLSGYTEARIQVRATYTGSGHSLSLEFHDGTTNVPLESGGTGPTVTIASSDAVSGAIVKSSPWVTIDSVALADVLVRAVHHDGDGVKSPTITAIDIQLK